METQPKLPKLPKLTRDTGVHAHLELLGLQSLNEASGTFTRRASFEYAPVLRLYRLEVPALFGILQRDGLDRGDPNLLDVELDNLLEDVGPLIWPAPGDGSREHLRKPDRDTLYKVDLVYPRDGSMCVMRIQSFLAV